MNTLLRPAIVVLIVVPLAACVFGLRFGCDSTDLRKLIREALVNEELEQARGALFHRIETREQTVRILIVQRCCLRQALARFGELDDEWSNPIAELSRRNYRDRSEVKKNYQYIVALVKDLLEDQPEEATAVLRRLEEEYRQLRADK